jgi:putative ABC transport system permease protein
MDTILSDLRHGMRTLRRSPGFACIAIATLAIGIGANVGLFSIVNSVILRPLTLIDSDRLVIVWQNLVRREAFGISHTGPDYVAYRSGARSFEQLAAFLSRNVAVTGRGDPAELEATIVSREYFDVVRVRPLVGRTFTAEEFADSASNVTVVSENIWRNRFGSDPAIVGQRIVINGTPRTIIGVIAARELWPRESDFYFTLPDIFHQTGEGTHMFSILGRLKEGTTIEQAEIEMSALADRLDARRAENDRGYTVSLQSAHESVTGGSRATLMLLLGAVAFVLLIVCANIAGLQTARAAARAHEMAVRRALGASRGRIVRQLVAESAIVALASGALGFLLAQWSVEAMRLLAPAPSNSPAVLPRLDEVRIDSDALLFTLAIVLAAALLTGLTPALFSSSTASSLLKEGARLVTDRRSALTRSALVVAEVAVALVLVIGAGIATKSLLALRSIPLGFDPRNAVAVDLDLPSVRYGDRERRVELIRQLETRVRGLPGVVGVGSTRALPLESGGPDTEFSIVGRPPEAIEQERPSAFFTPVTPRYHEAMRVRLVRGRYLSDGDNVPSAAKVVVVNDAFVRRHFANENPIGQRLLLGDGSTVEIVGQIANLRQRFLRFDPAPAMFVPYAHMPELSVSMVVRTATEPGELIDAIHRELWALDPNLPVEEWTLQELLRWQTSSSQLEGRLLVTFAAAALLLSVLGIYALVNFMVTQRRREIGVRIALGAARSTVVQMVLRQGVVLTALGVTIGLVGAIALSRALEITLYGVSATDPGMLAGAAIVLSVVALAATFVPARRASRVDPMVALRD